MVHSQQVTCCAHIHNVNVSQSHTVHFKDSTHIFCARNDEDMQNACSHLD